MPTIAIDKVDQLLRDAELRLQQVSAPSVTKTSDVVSCKKSGTPTNPPAKSSEKLSVRTAQPSTTQSSQKPDTAGSNWFNLPKTKQTPEFKRDWQIMRMRSLLDPKHQKKSLRAEAPMYSHVGEVIAGPTEFYSARLTRKERKGTLLAGIIGGYDKGKMQAKYVDIQHNKTSGKKAFYRNLVSKRRNRQN